MSIDFRVTVVRHEAERMQMPVGPDTALGQCFLETLMVGVVLEDWLPPITPIHHVMRSSLILHSQPERQNNRSRIKREDTF